MKKLYSAEKNGFCTQKVLVNNHINIFWNSHINIDNDIDIFKNGHIDMNVFKKCWYINNRYGLSIYRTPLPDPHRTKAKAKRKALARKRREGRARQLMKNQAKELLKFKVRTESIELISIIEDWIPLLMTNPKLTT